ncbi:MAG: cell division protein FtsL [Rhodobacteraceae bacterium]|nr:cell division protein FtsL [Paracoccaceae bacterium]
MRLIFGVLLGLSVLGLAFWAYQENYRTRQALADKRALERELGELQEHRNVLRAEWAYLNRPERLRELTELNFETLRLLPMTPDQFGRIDQVAYPPRPPSAPGEPELAGGTLPVAAADGASR